MFFQGLSQNFQNSFVWEHVDDDMRLLTSDVTHVMPYISISRGTTSF